MAQLKWCIVTQIAFVWLSPLCALNAFSNRLAVNNWICIATPVEFVVWFSNASSNWLPEQMQIRTHCICLLFTTMFWYIRRSMLPLQLWIHLSKSLEISHEEDRDKRESTQSVRAWRCRALMWVFISIQIDPVIIFSQDFLLQLLLWLVSGHRHLLRLQMVSKEAYYTKEKSCTTWQDMFRHRLPQNRCSIMHNFAVFWRKFAHRCDLIYENDGTPKDSRAV